MCQAHAADLPGPALPIFVAPSVGASTSPYGFLSEFRFGLFAHGVYEHEFGSVDINGEVLTLKPYHLEGDWDYLVPRFHLGGNLNTAGGTSDVYSGMTWNFPVWRRFFGELTFGGDANDGNTDKVFRNDTQIRVGCAVMFHESISFGYHLDEHWNILATAEHSSNAGFCSHNEGITAIGSRIGYMF